MECLLLQQDENAPAEPGEKQQVLKNNAFSESKGESDMQPTPLNLEASRSAADQWPEVESLILEIPPNAVNLRHGAHYVGLQTPNLQVASEGGELDQLKQDEQRVDSATSGTAPTPTPTAADHGFTHTNPAQEWYSDSQIAEFISYTRDCLTASPPRSLTTFYNVTTIASPTPSPACTMLREAYRAGLVQLAQSTGLTEVFTVGAPPPVTPFAGGFGPHWWVGKAPAQVLAGPLAEYRNVRNAKKTLDRKTNVKQYKNRELDRQRRKTVEGVRRQEQGLRMCEDKDEDVETSEDSV
ncbi:hypothetical protein E8E12_009028 [Didymella heteroderae]|uniref:Uncharacterized protein n=1 Tax=Didymella heteroderae TaxID=1769908 RepID=A0A9P4WT82_9PLEO|nr:hypothetical protein E8E12_009028 [Didymella heteroderae]